MKKRHVLYLFLFLLPVKLSFASPFTYRPYYAQSSNLAYNQSLGFVSIVLPNETSSIQNASSFLVDKGITPVFTAGYGMTPYASHSLDLAYVSHKSVLGVVFGLEYIFNFIPKGTVMNNNNYFTGKVDAAFAFEQVLATGLGYSFGSNGNFGVNLKIPISSYKKGKVDAGFLLGASYSINFFGIDFMVGLSNIGGMYLSRVGKFKGIYADIQAGMGYSYLDERAESVFSLGISIENNLGEYINHSLVFGLGGKIRLFSSGMLKNKSLINDTYLKNKDKEESNPYLKDLSYANIYLNLGFQLSKDSNFSLGLSSQLNTFLVDVGVIFPSASTQRFGFYVSLGSSL